MLYDLQKDDGEERQEEVETRFFLYFSMMKRVIVHCCSAAIVGSLSLLFEQNIVSIKHCSNLQAWTEDQSALFREQLPSMNELTSIVRTEELKGR